MTLKDLETGLIRKVVIWEKKKNMEGNSGFFGKMMSLDLDMLSLLK